MAKQIINNGAFDNDPSAEKIRISFDKVNSNFTELYKGIQSLSTTENVSVTHEIDWEFGNSNLTMTANTVFNEINLPPLGVEKTITIYLYGNFSPTDIIAWGIIGQPYDGVNGSQIVVQWKGDGTYHAVRNNLV